jgi:hypothetical protein
MRVLTAPAFLIARRSLPLGVVLARWRLWFALRAQLGVILRRGDRRLLADAGAADLLHLTEDDRQAVRQSYWML